MPLGDEPTSDVCNPYQGPAQPPVSSAGRAQHPRGNGSGLNTFLISDGVTTFLAQQHYLSLSRRPFFALQSGSSPPVALGTTSDENQCATNFGPNQGITAARAVVPINVSDAIINSSHSGTAASVTMNCSSSAKRPNQTSYRARVKMVKSFSSPGFPILEHDC